MAKYTHIAAFQFHSELDLGEIEPIRNRNFVKPYGGFWLSIDEDWERWCSSEEPEWLEGHRYSITLKDDARILRVDSASALESLPKQIPEMFQGMPAELLSFVLEQDTFLDFEEIAKHYDVLEVYAGSGEGLYSALYGWDCDSAIVLNPAVILKVEEIERYEPDDSDWNDD